jgi:hypothetical protein
MDLPSMVLDEPSSDSGQSAAEEIRPDPCPEPEQCSKDLSSAIPDVGTDSLNDSTAGNPHQSPLEVDQHLEELPSAAPDEPTGILNNLASKKQQALLTEGSVAHS